MKATIAFLVLLSSVSAFAGKNKSVVCNAHEPEGRPDTIIRINMKSKSSIKAFIYLEDYKQTFDVPAAASKVGEDTRIDISAFHSSLSMVLPKAIFKSENRNQPITVMLDNGSVNPQVMTCIGKR